MFAPIRTGITDELGFEEIFSLIENFDPVTSQYFTTKQSPRNYDVFLHYATEED